MNLTMYSRHSICFAFIHTTSLPNSIRERVLLATYIRQSNHEVEAFLAVQSEVIAGLRHDPVFLLAK